MEGKFIKLAQLQRFEQLLRSMYVRRDEPTVVVFNQTEVDETTGDLIITYDSDRTYVLVNDDTITPIDEIYTDDVTGEIYLTYEVEDTASEEE
jgi:hypothetical protein